MGVGPVRGQIGRRLWTLLIELVVLAALAVWTAGLSAAQAAPAGGSPGPARQERVTNAPPPSDTPVTGERRPVYLTYKTPFEFHLTVITAALGVFMALLLSVMAWKTGITEDFVRSFMVVIIVFGALYLVVAGYSDEQTAPVFGLLGTIAGYIFGRTQGAAAAEAAKVAAGPGANGQDPQEAGKTP